MGHAPLSWPASTSASAAQQFTHPRFGFKLAGCGGTVRTHNEETAGVAPTACACLSAEACPPRPPISASVNCFFQFCSSIASMFVVAAGKNSRWESKSPRKASKSMGLFRSATSNNDSSSDVFGNLPENHVRVYLTVYVSIFQTHITSNTPQYVLRQYGMYGCVW